MSTDLAFLDQLKSLPREAKETAPSRKRIIEIINIITEGIEPLLNDYIASAADDDEVEVVIVHHVIYALNAISKSLSDLDIGRNNSIFETSSGGSNLRTWRQKEDDDFVNNLLQILQRHKGWTQKRAAIFMERNFKSRGIRFHGKFITAQQIIAKNTVISEAKDSFSTPSGGIHLA